MTGVPRARSCGRRRRPCRAWARRGFPGKRHRRGRPRHGKRGGPRRGRVGLAEEWAGGGVGLASGGRGLSGGRGWSGSPGSSAGSGWSIGTRHLPVPAPNFGYVSPWATEPGVSPPVRNLAACPVAAAEVEGLRSSLWGGPAIKVYRDCATIAPERSNFVAPKSQYVARRGLPFNRLAEIPAEPVDHGSSFARS